MAKKKKNLPAVVEVEGVHGYIDDKGVAWLKVEDVARGLGFVDIHQKKVFATSGENFSPTSGGKIYENIRWARINGYLAEYEYPPVKAGDFIPENMFYLLAMKANNEAAKTFQLKIANEILPSIRKTGSYSVDKINPLSGLAAAISKLADVEREKITLEREKLAHERDDFATAQLLRELASASGNNSELREELVLASAKRILGEDFYNDDDLLPRLRRR